MLDNIPKNTMFITRAREFMHLHINLIKLYLMPDDIETHFKIPWYQIYEVIFCIFLIYTFFYFIGHNMHIFGQDLMKNT